MKKLPNLYLVVAALFVSSPLYSSGNVTFRDINSTFYAHNTTGALNYGSSGHFPSIHQTTSDSGFFRGRINPKSQFTEMCENDWSVVNLVIFDDLIDIPHAVFKDFVGRMEMVSFIDGDGRKMVETPVEIIQYNPLPMWSKNWGYFIEPGALEPGDHVLEWIVLLDGEILSMDNLLIEVLASDYPECS